MKAPLRCRKLRNDNNNDNLSFDTSGNNLLSYEDSKRGKMSLLPNTERETTHNYAACGRKDNTKTAQKHKALMTSHYMYLGQKRKS
jgi:hypothetical protein